MHRNDVGCGRKFATNDKLIEHYSSAHTASGSPAKGKMVGEKRKIVDEDVTPIIEPMPAHIAKKNRAVYDGVSRSLNIGVGNRGRKA